MYRLLTPDDLSIWAYERTTEDEQLLVLSNFYSLETTFTLPETMSDADVLIQNYPDVAQDGRNVTLRPYESVMFYRTT